MIKVFKKLFNICLIICLLIANFYIQPVEASSVTLGDLKKELEQFIKEYEENKEKEQLTKEEMASIENQINNIKSNISQISKEIVELNEEIEKLNKDIEEKKSEIENILSFSQISSGESAYLEYAFGAKDFTDFIYRVAISEQLTSYNDQLVDQYRSDIEANEKKKEELNQKKADLNKQQSNLQVELEKIKYSLQEIDEYSLSIEEQIEAKKAEIELYESLGCELDETLKECRTKTIPKDTSFARPMTSAYVTGWYGMRTHPVSGVRKMHDGTDISTMQSGDIPIYSVANGVVKKIVQLKYNSATGRYYDQCGGRRVYIEHNVNGTVYTTGYLHLRRIDVEEGQIVTKETQIGIMGGDPKKEYWDRACSTASHLHIEISTGTFSENTYEAYRTAAEIYVNFPKQTYKYWYDRTSRY